MERLFDNIDTNVFGPPSCAGVYAVCVSWPKWILENHKERIVYIGSSQNVLKRVSNLSHPYRKLYDKLEDALVYTKTIETSDYEELEKKLIRLYRPLLNKQWKDVKD